MDEETIFLNIQAYKYDGTLYRQWNGAKLIKNDEDYLVLFLKKTKVKETEKQKWVISNPCLWFFSKKYFFNYTLNIREGKFYFYVNIASPVFVEDNTVKYIDFDYDIKSYPDRYFSIVDQREFNINSEKWYSKELKEIIYQNISILTEIVVKKNHYFDYAKIRRILNYLEMNKYLLGSELLKP